MENRIMKFRVWDNLRQEMLNPEEIWIKPDGAWVAVNRVNGIAFSETDSLNGVLIQYTGLKDKNGKEIYEGDIVEAYTLFDKDVKIKGEVVFTDSGMWKAIDAVYRDAEYLFELVKSKDRCEIIGNIYESPELLNPLK